jgi:putative heme-binding domain-containing protein
VLFGDGQAVGPDITVNGRETLDLLLSNLLDPNLVVGKDYYAHTVVTGDGRALTGLLVEDSPQRVTVRVAGGTEEVVARRDILRHSVAPVSLMPEELENTVTEEEFRDLIAFLRFDEAPPAPTATVSETDLPAAERRVTLEQTSYGRATVGVRFPGAEDAVTELFSLRHSNDNRTYLHPLHAPGGATLSGSDAGQVPGLFFAHPDVGGTDFWGEGGWIRSRGLRGARQGSEAVELVAENDWLTSRRGGELVLTEVQRFTVPAPTAADRCHVDIEWRLTPRRDLTLERARLGGLFLRVAAHEAAQEVTPRGRRWVGLSAAFEEGRRGGVALFPHPDNPAYPHRARGLDDGLLGIAVSASEPLRCEAGETLRLRFRLLFHDGSLERDALSEEYRRWIEEE